PATAAGGASTLGPDARPGPSSSGALTGLTVAEAAPLRLKCPGDARRRSDHTSDASARRARPRRRGQGARGPARAPETSPARGTLTRAVLPAFQRYAGLLIAPRATI